MNRGLWLACSLALGTAFAASGCYMGPQPPPPAYVEPAPAPVADDGTAYPATPPPDPIPEYQPPAPAYGYSWVGGYWDWIGLEWSWNAGYWAPSDQAYLFVGPRFLFVDGRPVYYRPYWQGPGGYRAYGYGYRGRAPRGRVARAPLCGARRLACPAQRGVASHARTPTDLARRAGARSLSRCAAATRDSAGRRRRRLEDRRAGFHAAPAPAFHPAPAAHSAPSTRRRWRRPHAPLADARAPPPTSVAGAEPPSTLDRATECTATDPRP